MNAPEFIAIAAALAEGDVDAAIEHGLLAWDGEAAGPHAAGLDAPAIALLAHVRSERLAALAARDRHDARNARLERLARQRRARQAATLATNEGGKPALSGAAAAALARALARAGK
ncbi:hypothetical protein [Luteimonas sp. e5]